MNEHSKTRRRHGAQFKQEVIGACRARGASVAGGAAARIAPACVAAIRAADGVFPALLLAEDLREIVPTCVCCLGVLLGHSQLRTQQLSPLACYERVGATPAARTASGTERINTLPMPGRRLLERATSRIRPTL